MTSGVDYAFDHNEILVAKQSKEEAHHTMIDAMEERYYLVHMIS
jgi:hypothetical protein